MIRLHHIAVWVSDLEAAAEFWTLYFGASVGALYESKRQQGFVSRFATLQQAKLQIELMSKPGLKPSDECLGWAHIALHVGDENEVDAAAARFARDNKLLLGPRRTGDGYYEALIRGPDDLLIELVA